MPRALGDGAPGLPDPAYLHAGPVRLHWECSPSDVQRRRAVGRQWHAGHDRTESGTLPHGGRTSLPSGSQCSGSVLPVWSGPAVQWTPDVRPECCHPQTWWPWWSGARWLSALSLCDARHLPASYPCSQRRQSQNAERGCRRMRWRLGRHVGGCVGPCDRVWCGGGRRRRPLHRRPCPARQRRRHLPCSRLSRSGLYPRRG